MKDSVKNLVVEIDFSKFGIPISKETSELYSDVKHAIQECVKDFISGSDYASPTPKKAIYCMNDLKVTIKNKKLRSK